MEIYADRLIHSAKFMLPMCEFMVPALFGFFIVALNKSARICLSENSLFIHFFLVMFLWIALIPWAAIWIAVDGMQKPGPLWAAVPNFLVFFLWPVLAYRLIDRMAKVKGWAIFYVLCNLPGWLFCFIVAGMAVAGDWV